MDILKNIGSAVKLAGSKTVFWTKKNSPEILLVTGIITAGASLAFAVKASLDIGSVTKPANKKLKELKTKFDDQVADNDINGQKETTKEIAKTYLKTGAEITKRYAPSAILFGISMASFVGSHNIIKGRNLALAAAYTTIESGYRNYRDRVKARFGEDIEREIFQDIREETIKTTKIDDDGNEVEVEEVAKVPHVDVDSDFVYLFDCSNSNWEKNGKLNLDWLIMQERFLNEKLRANGYLFLKDVYNALDIEPSILGSRKLQASRVIGWIYDPKDTTRDNYISFGLSDREGNLNERAMNMVRYGERNVFIEFNPDGDILTGNNGQKTFMNYAREV